MIYTHIAAAVFAAAGAWWAASQHYGLEIEGIRHAATKQDLANTSKAVRDMASFQKGLDNALSEFQATQQRNSKAQQDLGRVLLDLRGTSAGLRNDFAKLPERIATAAQPALAEYATTCTAVFESMAAGGQRLSEAGAGISAKADGHAADAQMIRKAWPATPKEPTK